MLQERLAAQAERLGKETDARVASEVAAARATADQQSKEALLAREEELVRTHAATEGELAATRRQLEEANARAAAAERRANEIEAESRREVARERELRFQEIEGKIGDLDERARRRVGACPGGRGRDCR